MLIEDRLYGKNEIDSPVLQELIESPTIQRLKGIGQLGVPDKYYHLTGYSRYEHSVGVMLLLKRLGAGEEEQIAGLLHDASHTAFSHVFDTLIGTEAKENFQDLNHLDRLCRTELGTLLMKYGYSLEVVSDHDRFSLLEQPAPEICADRIDYASREFQESTARTCIDGLRVMDGRIVFTEQATARLFADHFLERQRVNWGGAEAVNRYLCFAEALRYALDAGCISLGDFDQDDAYVLSRLENCSHDRIKTILAALKNKDLSIYPKKGVYTHKKFRHVDPLFMDNGQLTRLSDSDPEFKTLLETARQKSKAVPLYEI